jgi:malonyl CoA-acyl carrier protein transacylase
LAAALEGLHTRPERFLRAGPCSPVLARLTARNLASVHAAAAAAEANTCELLIINLTALPVDFTTTTTTDNTTSHSSTTA